ncbi:MAG TPA: DUF2076 domain-containing protein [Caulobacteraceae bacterium]|jgi:hypothetical protein
MTPDERTLLQNFLGDLTAARAGQKDGEAERMIIDALRASPDAAYLLVQHALLSDQALHAAQDQIASLQEQLRNAPVPAQPARFLGGQGGQPGPSPWARAAAPPPPAQDQYAPPPPQGGGFAGPGPFNRGGGLGSFLRNAGTTAAGVAGGALLFDGISSLFGGHRGGGFGGFGGGWGGQPTEIVENNYYDDNAGGGFDQGGDSGGWDTGGGDGGSFDT